MTSLSIITINYNNINGLKKTVASVKFQNRENIEHIIIDGNSSDGSGEYIRSHHKGRFVIENDTGIYDAMQKGLKLANSNYVMFLNSGDILVRDALKFLNEEIIKGYDIIYSNLSLIDESGGVLRFWRAGNYRKWKLFYGWMPPHPVFIAKKKILQVAGGFNKKYRISGDYDLMLRVFLMNKVCVKWIDRTLVQMEAGGVSNSSIKSIMYANVECLQSWSDINKVFIPFWILVTKPASKLIQLLRKDKIND